MKENSNNTDTNNTDNELFQMWEKAGSQLSDQQQLHKEKMESMITKTSTEFTSGIKRLLVADAIFKVILLFGFIILSAFNLANLFVLITNLVCTIIVVLVIKQERYLVEGINEIKEYQGSIRRFIEMEIIYYRGNIFRFPMVLAISVFLFYILGSLIYHSMKYGLIRPVEDLEDAIVLLAFLVCSFILAFSVYFPFFRNRLHHLQDLLTDIDNAELASEHIEKLNARRRKNIILSSVLIVLGLLMLIFLILAFR